MASDTRAGATAPFCDWVRRMGEHEAYHQAAGNRVLHWLCIPLEIFGVLLLLARPWQVSQRKRLPTLQKVANRRRGPPRVGGGAHAPATGGHADGSRACGGPVHQRVLHSSRLAAGCVLAQHSHTGLAGPEDTARPRTLAQALSSRPRSVAQWSPRVCSPPPSPARPCSWVPQPC